LDLFENEQKVLDDVTKRIEQVRKGGSFDFEEFESLVKEYGKLLKQLRKSIHFADRISNGLFKNNMVLDKKVHAETTALRFLESVRSLHIPHRNNDIADHITISIGVTTVRVKPKHQYMDYLDRADKALYMSKDTGRNKYTHLKYNNREGDGNEA